MGRRSRFLVARFDRAEKNVEQRDVESTMTDFLKTRMFFELPDDLAYLDGNSLGPLPRALPERMDAVLKEQWGKMLIRGWTRSGWMEQPTELGHRIGKLIGAEHESVVVGDTLSIRVYQALAAALAMRPGRRTVLSDTGNFPSDLYVARRLLDTIDRDLELKIVPPDEVEESIGEQTAVLLLTEVDYRTARKHDMRALTEVAHRSGALTVWDLAHSAGAIPVDLQGANADFAVGCTYKFLNGGPGSPAFIYVSSRHAEDIENPLAGWLGHKSPFEFSETYKPAPGVERMRIGTPPVIGMAALDVALQVWDIANIRDVSQKSAELISLFIDGVEASCPQLKLASPRDANRRGSQVSFTHAEGRHIMNRVIVEGVIGDFREPDIMRFGIAPLYNSEKDIELAIATLAKEVRKIC